MYYIKYVKTVVQKNFSGAWLSGLSSTTVVEMEIFT